jgi:hypothetical protein
LGKAKEKMEVLTGVLIESWVLIVGFLGAYAWLIRLESRAVNNTKRLEALDVRREKDLEDLEKRQMIQRAEDIQLQRDRDLRQERAFEAIHNDIKILLQRTANNEKP